MSDDMKKRFGADGRNGDEKSPRAGTPGDSKTDRSSSAPDSVDGDLSIDELMRRYLPSSSGEQSASDAKSGSRQTEKSARPAARKAEPSPEPEAQPPKKSGGLFARMRAAAKPEDNSPAVPDEKVFDELTRDEETRPMTPEEKEISDSLMAVLSGTQERQKAAAERRVRERREADRSDLSAAFEDAVRKGSTASGERVAAERRSAERFAPAETDVPAEEPSPAKPAEEAEEPKKPAAPAVTEERYNSGTDATIRFDPAVVDEMNAAFADESDAQKKGTPKAGPNAGSDGSPDTDTREVETSFFRFRRTKDKKSETVREEIPGKDEPQENAPAEETREVPVPEDLRETPAAERPAADEVFHFSDPDGADGESDTPEETGMDDEDKNLRIALGMDDTLDRHEGVGTAAKLIRKMEEDEKRREAERRELARQDYIEYESYAQTEEIASAYTSANRSVIIRLIVAAAFSVALFLFENLNAFGMKFGGALNPNVYPVVYTMVSLQLFLIIAMCAYPELVRGFKGLFTLSPKPESVTSLIVLAAVVCSVLTATLTSEDLTPVMYNFCAASAVLATLVYTWLNLRREMYSFNIVSSHKPKHVFQSLANVDDKGAHDEGSNILRIENADFVNGYFYRSESTLRSTRIYLHIVMLLLVVCSLILGCVAAISGNGAFNALRIFFITLTAALPFAMYFIFSYPFFKINRDSYDEGSTIVGESSLEEYAGATDITFDDLNAFPADKVQVLNVKFYGNNRIDKIFYYAASVFKAAGGPLSQVLDNVVDQPLSENVQILDASAGFLAANVDGRHFLFGRSRILRQLNIEIPEDAVEEDSFAEGDVSIMYIIRDLKLVAKLYIRYNMDESFENVIRHFTSNGTCICVRTLDPNIDEEMIAVKLKDDSYPVRVLKSIDAVEKVDKISSGIVTCGPTKNLLRIVSCCDRILNYRRLIKVFSIVSLLVTALLMLICSVSGTVGLIAPWIVFLYQLIWVIPAVLFIGQVR